MQLGSRTIDWEPFSKFIGCEAFEELFRNFRTPLFIADIRNLQSVGRSDEAISALVATR